MEDEKPKADSQEEIDKNYKMLMDLKKNHDPFCTICKDPEEIVQNPSQKMEKKEAETTPKENEEQELFHSDLSKNTKFVNAL
jgi:hypothetical protein